MNKLLTTIVLLSYFFSFGQEIQDSQKIDINSIVFKAKLFTISQNEYLSKNDLINHIDEIEYESYNDKEFVFFKIKGRYYCYNAESYYKTDWCERIYYVSYSIKKDYFYLLGGFRNDNIKIFVNDFNNSGSSYRFDNTIGEEKLNKFLRLIIMKKIRKAKKLMKST